MKHLIILAGASALVLSAMADPYTITKQRAKSVSGQAPAPQARPAPAAPSQSAPAPNPALVAMQQNISSLANDLAVLQADPLKKQPLINDLSAAVQRTNPSKTTVARLADDLAKALAGKKLTQEQRMKFAQCLRAIFNSSHVSPAQQRTILEDAQKILQAAGVTADAATAVVADLKAVAAETK